MFAMFVLTICSLWIYCILLRSRKWSRFSLFAEHPDVCTDLFATVEREPRVQPVPFHFEQAALAAKDGKSSKGGTDDRSMSKGGTDRSMSKGSTYYDRASSKGGTDYDRSMSKGGQTTITTGGYRNHWAQGGDYDRGTSKGGKNYDRMSKGGSADYDRVMSKGGKYYDRSMSSSGPSMSSSGPYAYVDPPRSSSSSDFTQVIHDAVTSALISDSEEHHASGVTSDYVWSLMRDRDDRYGP